VASQFPSRNSIKSCYQKKKKNHELPPRVKGISLLLISSTVFEATFRPLPFADPSAARQCYQSGSDAPCRTGIPGRAYAENVFETPEQ